MELKITALNPGGSPSDCVSDPEEKEVSDEDDDDRNHKHRRRDTHSQSLEGDSLEPVFTRPYRKHNRSFANGHAFRENESQASGTWRNYNMGSLDKDFPLKFDKRRNGLVSFPRGPLDMNQRIRPNQTFYGESGPGRGRGRDSGSWNQLDSRLSSVDIASQMVQQGPITSSLFAGSGLPNVSNSQSASWNAFGLIPRIANGGLDAIHPIGLQGTLRSTVNSSLNMGIPRQRCRDFEERGFCLRGEMCPMEHGVNRIVVEDVQSLSQFNLTVSIPSAQLAVPGTVPSVGASLTTSMNGKALCGKTSKPGMTDDRLGLNGGCSGSANISGADLYDPDQPLWNNNGPETPNTLLGVDSPKNDETESLLGVDSDCHNVRLRDCADNVIGSQTQATNSTVWGRIGSIKSKLEVKDKTDSTVSTARYLENKANRGENGLANFQGASHQGKRIITEDSSQKTFLNLSGRMQSDAMHNVRKPTQKAQRTLFVNGIPQKSNKREYLLSHFQKFGEVIDIYIPLNSERAFVQFSRREDAEAALRAPDAVMGNRFIRLWWANRDSIPDDGMNSSSNVSVTPRGGTVASVPPQPPIANKGRDNLQTPVLKGSTVPASDASVPVADHPKPAATNGAKAPPLQKKLETLEQLKEELRKKQEQLDQKRNDFRRQLDKLQKQATGVKGEVVTEPAAKRHKVGIAADSAKATTSRSSDSSGDVITSYAEMMVDKNKAVENVVSSSPKTTTMMQQESVGLSQPIHPLASVGCFQMNRYKLDNRPTSFKILPPLPAGLENVASLKEYFSSYGDLSNVVLEDIESCDGDADGSETQKKGSAYVTFTSRRSAERAFVNGKCWQGKNMQFVWVSSSISGNDPSSKEDSLSTPKLPDVQPEKRVAPVNSQEASASGNGEPESSEKSDGMDMELVDVSKPCTLSMLSEKEDSLSTPKFPDVQPEKRVVPVNSEEAAASGNGETKSSGKKDGMDMALVDVSKPCPLSMLSEKESHKSEPSAASMSGEEELMKCEPSPTATSGEKSPAEISF